jgi:hypothetical protein
MATYEEWKSTKKRVDEARRKLNSAVATLEFARSQIRGLLSHKLGQPPIEEQTPDPNNANSLLPSWPSDDELNAMESEFKSALIAEDAMWRNLSSDDQMLVKRE